MSTQIRPGTGFLIGALTALLAAGCGGNNGSFDSGADGSLSEAGGDAAPDGGGNGDATPDARPDGGGGDATADAPRDAAPDGTGNDAAPDATPEDTGTDAGGTDAGPTATIGDTCDAATVITAPGTLTHQGLDGLTADYAVDTDGNNCQHASGAEGVYAITVPAGQKLTVTVTPEGDLDPVVNLVAGPAANCGAQPLVCLAGADDGGGGEPETAQYLNAGTADETVYILVADYASSSGGDTAFAITTTVDTPQAGDTCATATPIATPGTLSGQSLMGFGQDIVVGFDAVRCQNYSGAERVYSITVPPGKRLTATVAGDSNLDAVVNLIAGPADTCTAAPLTCLTGADSSGSGGTETAGYLNGGTADQTVYIVVGSYSNSDTGNTATFDLTTGVDTPPDGDTCNTATMIASAGSLTGQSLTGFGHDYDTGSGTHCQYADGPERVYSVTVPAGQRLTATVTPTGTFDPVLTLIDAPASNCSSSTLACPASANAGYTGDPETVQYLNATTADQTLFVLVASYSTSPTDTAFTLDTLIDTPPPGDTCPSAVALAAPGTLATEDLAGAMRDYGDTLSYGTGCSYYTGAERAYAITVPAGMLLTASVTGSAGLDPVVNLAAGTAADCGASSPTCAGNANSTGAGETETARYFNTTGADETVYIVVGSYDTAPTSTGYSLTTTIAPPPPGDTCVDPQLITAAGTLTDEDLGPFTRNFVVDSLNDTCQNANGADKVYAIVVPAGRQLSVSATGSTSLDVVLNLVAAPADNCAAATPACLAGADDTGSGSAESVTYTNSTGADETVFIIVSSYWETSSTTTYSLTTMLQ